VLAEVVTAGTVEVKQNQELLAWLEASQARRQGGVQDDSRFRRLQIVYGGWRVERVFHAADRSVGDGLVESVDHGFSSVSQGEPDCPKQRDPGYKAEKEDNACCGRAVLIDLGYSVRRPDVGESAQEKPPRRTRYAVR
jgi:hypothetical protein